MDELKQRIISVMRSMEENGDTEPNGGCNMEHVAQKLSTDFNDSQFNTAMDELVGDGTIRFTDSITAVLV